MERGAAGVPVGGMLPRLTPDFGTPEQVVDRFLRLKTAGWDGIQISFFDFAPDLDYFAERVLPLMKQAGLR